MAENYKYEGLEYKQEITVQDIENIAVKYIVDKNTYLASSSTVSFDFEMQGMKMSMEMDAKMSNINNVTDIVIPEEVLNAKEIPHQ